MEMGRDSVRFVNPGWNEIGPDQLLWPTFFYGLGLTERNPSIYSDDSSNSNRQDD